MAGADADGRARRAGARVDARGHARNGADGRSGDPRRASGARRGRARVRDRGRRRPGLCMLVRADTAHGALPSSCLRQLAGQNARLQELDRLKDEFVGLVSHELRTPLTSITGYVELLQDDGTESLTEEQAEFLGDRPPQRASPAPARQRPAVRRPARGGPPRPDARQGRPRGHSRPVGGLGAASRRRPRRHADPRGGGADGRARRGGPARAAARQPRLERPQVHPRATAASTCGWSGGMDSRSCAWPTPGSGSPRRSSTTSSSASTARPRRSIPRCRAPGSASTSRRRSWKRTAARSTSRARSEAGPRSRSSCRSRRRRS